MTNDERHIYPLISRRGFMGATAGATLAALAGREPTLGAQAIKSSATADSVIILWMAGGMAHCETFDPKRYVPFEKGVDPKGILSTFPSIPTVLPGVRLSEGLEQIATVLDRATLVRSAVVADLLWAVLMKPEFQLIR